MTIGRTAKGWRVTATSASFAVLAAMGLTGCAVGRAQVTAGTRLYVVAAESSWGSIAEQLGGDKIEITSLIDNPATDPHDYEPTAADARAVAMAAVVVVNGVGYDGWASKLVAANPASGRQLVDVGKVVGAAADANPHRWYNPVDVHHVVDAITTALTKADPADAAYFTAQRATFVSIRLARYNALIDHIRTTYGGTPVGASESIFAMLAPALGLNLVTPQRFLRAISQGSEPTAADKLAIDKQIKRHAIKVYVYNSQNATPDVRAQVDEARAAGIPVATITETLTPATASFQDWQADQLQALANALATASEES